MLVQPWSLLGPNPNAAWFQKKRLWFVYVFLIYVARIVCAMFFMDTGLAWTITNIGHAMVTFIILHWTKGSPFPHLASNDDQMTVWEQIEIEKIYTPTKKVFTSVPIVIFALAIHYSEYSALEFVWNAIALGFCIIPKMPFMNKVRLFGINSD